MNSIQDLWPETSLGAWMDSECEPELVSVILPTYNRTRFIADAMNSVRKQTYRPIELIIVDDGSTDDTPDVVNRWKKTWSDDQLEVYYYQQANRGAPAARNRGLVASKGEYIQFLDSDDVLHPRKISRQVNVLQESDSDFVFSSTGSFENKVDWDTDPVYMSSFSGDNRYLLGFLHRLQAPQTWSTEGGLYIRSTCLKIGPWHEELTFDQDWEYNIRFLASRPSISECHGIMTLKRNHDQARVGSARRSRLGGERQLAVVQCVAKNLEAKEFLKHQKVQEGLFWHYMLATHSALKLDDQRIARKAAGAALRTAPYTSWRCVSILLRIVSLIPVGGSIYRKIINPVRKKLRSGLL